MIGTRGRNTVVLLIAAVVLGTFVGTAAAAGPAGTQQIAGDVTPPAFVVSPNADGSANLTVSYTFDLSDQDRQDAFQQLRDSSSATAAFEDRFAAQLGSVVSDAANATDRDMAVTDVAISFETDGQTGIVTVPATWEGLAATNGETLTITEPFASGFQPDRTFAVVVPDGYAVSSVSPTPDQSADGAHTWESGTDLSGFELTMETTDSMDGGDGDDGSDGSTDGGDGPGFDVVVGVLAVLGAALLASRRR